MSATTKTIQMQKNKEGKRELPEGWRWVKLGEVCELRTGGTPSKSESTNFGGDIRWLVSGDIHQGEITDCVGRITIQGMENSNAALLPPDSVMIALNGQGKTRGMVALLKVEATCNQSLVSIIPRDRETLLSLFLLYQLQMRYQELRNLTGDSHRSGLNMVILNRLGIIVAPIEVQRRIAAILKDQMAAVEKAREAAQARLVAVKALPAAFLRQVFPQPGQPLPEGWRWVKLGEVCEFILDGTHGSPVREPNSVPLLSAKNVYGGTLHFDDFDTVTQDEFETFNKRLQVRENDVLLTIVGSIGRVAIVQTLRPFVLLRSVSVLRPIQAILFSEFLFRILESELVQSQMTAKTKQGSQPGIYLKEIRELSIPLPPLPEQRRISAILKEQMTAADKARTASEEERNTINALPAALLRRAFNGEL